ncbi:uncharacterized protein CXorf49 homolog isoform X1 [Ictidomys tridecemlineatus]
MRRPRCRYRRGVKPRDVCGISCVFCGDRVREGLTVLARTGAILCLRPWLPGLPDMSSIDEASVQEDGFGLDGVKRTIVTSAGPRAPRVPGLGLELGPPRSGEGEGGLPDPEGYEFELEAQGEQLEAGGAVLRVGEGRPGSMADKKGDVLDFVPHLAVESVASVQQLTGQETPGAHRYLSPESWVAELSAIWANAEAGPSRRWALAPGSLETLQAPSAAPLRHPSGPQVGRAWGNPGRGTKTRMMGSGEAQLPPSDPESSDEFTEIQLVRVSLCPKEGGQTSSSSPREPGDTANCACVGTRGNFLQIPTSLPTSAPGRLTSAMERQALGELASCSSKKRQSVIWGKGGSRPSYPGAAAAAVAAAAAAPAPLPPPPPPPPHPPPPPPATCASGGLPRATPRKKAIQEKKSLGGGSKFSLGRVFPIWGQRLKAAPLETATLPPIPGVPLFGRSKRYSLVPLEPKQPKHSGTAKRSMAKKTQESHPVAGDDNSPNRASVPTAQCPVHRPGTPCLCMHRGDFNSGDPNTRAPQRPASSQPLDLSQGGLTPRGPASGDQESAVHHPVLERQQQQPPGTQGCLQCVALQKEIEDLKEQLAVMQSLDDKFQVF